jgi:hypothetical protein
MYVEWEGINTRDYPDFSDAFISYAEHDDGTPYNEEELEALNNEDNYDLLMSHLY